MLPKVLLPLLWIAAFFSMFIGGSDKMLAQTGGFIVWVLWTSGHLATLSLILPIAMKQRPPPPA